MLTTSSAGDLLSLLQQSTNRFNDGEKFTVEEEAVETIKLKVAEAEQKDVVKGVVRIDESFRKKLGLHGLDVVEITGNRSTPALAASAYASDAGLDIIRMDGLEELRGVVIVGATNRPDIIDPALIRPGRFDELILVPVPDEQTRLRIFEVHTKQMVLAENVKLSELVNGTDGFTGADIAAVCKKAGRFALRENIEADKVSMKHFHKSLQETGPSVTSDTMKYYETLGGELRTKQSKEIEGPAYV